MYLILVDEVMKQSDLCFLFVWLCDGLVLKVIVLYIYYIFGFCIILDFLLEYEMLYKYERFMQCFCQIQKV